MTLARGLRGRRAGIELRPAVPLAFQAVQLSLATSRTLASEDRSHLSGSFSNHLMET
jgi:hypothetical protein